MRIEPKRRGPKSRLPMIEKRLGMAMEHHVMQQMARGRRSSQIAGALGVHHSTLIKWLRVRGYRIECQCRMVAIQDEASKHTRPRASNVGQSRGIAGDFPPATRPAGKRGAGCAQGARRPAD